MYSRVYPVKQNIARTAACSEGGKLHARPRAGTPTLAAHCRNCANLEQPPNSVPTASTPKKRTSKPMALPALAPREVNNVNIGFFWPGGPRGALQKSFCTGDQKFYGLQAQLSCKDVRDLTASR
jgi:hypothetical protein